MSAQERVLKYYEDALALLQVSHTSSASTSSTSKSSVAAQKTVINFGKIEIEVKKLSAWLQKHQNESLPENSKTKLFSAIELYFRCCLASDTTQPILCYVFDMIGNYLQLPEGKLLSAKHKQKAMSWLAQLTALNSAVGTADVAAESAISTWTIEAINDDNSLVLLSTTNEELWKEDFTPSNAAEYSEEIKLLCSQHETVLLQLEERSNKIIEVSGVESSKQS